MSGSLAERHRPHSFDDFVGQENSVKILSTLAQSGIARHLLLKGDVGSGKTSFARVYAAALLCEARLADGSPCRKCKRCQSREFFLEYDTPFEGGAAENIVALLKEVDQRSQHDRLCVFLDECHELSTDATDLFLKRLEAKSKNVVYAFATTDPSRLSPAFCSRLMNIDVHFLTQARSILFLQAIAQKENIDCTPQGLRLLAAFEQGCPRAMLTTLETIKLTGHRVDLDNVKDHYGRDNTDHIVNYISALALGDASCQVQAMQAWPGPLQEKLRVVQRFLTTIYYNNILGDDVVVYPVAYALAKERDQITSLFCKRWAVERPSDLASRWVRILDFWVKHIAVHPSLTLPLFEDLVNRQLNQPEPENNTVVAIPLVGTPISRDQPVDPRSERQHLSYEDAYELISRASFYIQQFGRCLNAAFVIWPGYECSEDDLREAVHQFRTDLEVFLKERLDAILLFERYESACGRLVAHIPDFAKYNAQLEDFCAEYRGALRCKIDLRLASIARSRNKSVGFHWREVLRLCEGLPAPSHSADAFLERGIYGLLGRTRETGVMKVPLIEFSGGFGHLQKEGLNGLPYQSALNASAWAKLKTGWEFHEYDYREKQSVIHQRQIEELESLDAGESEYAELRLRWENGARSREDFWKNKWKSDA